MLFEQKKYLLLIDRNPYHGKIVDYFAKFDYQVYHQVNLRLSFNQDVEPAAILVNWSYVKRNMRALNKLYHRYTSPLIVISDKIDENRCVRTLEAGADDFVVKSVHPRELHARINAISRRVQWSTQVTAQEREVLMFADWRLYPSSRRVFNKNNKELTLSPGEYALLLALANHPQRVLGRDFLLQLTKHCNLKNTDRRIDVQVSRLRQKIEVDAKKPTLIKTVRNVGYLFTARVLNIKEG